jgi:LysR family transcriptional regulator, low CO2-responsive transcriptional regulator
MNLKQLEVFLAVAESGSFSRGAEASYLTQSTVSQHISALEAELDMRLLDRTPRGAQLTAAGHLLVTHARRIVNEVREARNALARLRGVEDVALTVGASSIPGIYLLPRLLPALRRRHPGLHLTVLQGDSKEITDRLIQGEFELGVVGSRFAVDGCEFVPVGSDRIILVAGKDHPWFDQPVVPPAALRGQLFIFREEGSGTGKTVEEALEAAGIDPADLQVKIRLGSNEAVKTAAVAGTGLSFVPALSVRRELEQDELREVQVSGLSIARQFFLVTRTGRELSPAATAFSGILKELSD